MKAIVALQNKINSIQNKAFECLKKKEGQNTVEYMLMLGVIVGVALLVGKLVKSYMPELFDQVKAKITGNMSEM